MVLFKFRYFVMEVFLDPNRELAGDETIILSQFNVSKAIKDSIHLYFGECGLAAAIGSFQVSWQDYQKIWYAITMVRNIGNCPCDNAKFELYVLTVGDSLSPQVLQQVHNCIEKIKVLKL
ncbi:hypothetical protein AMTRI_Chr04g251670 [Amborella trichopoda]